MINIIQHIPNFVEGIEPQEVEVDTTLELLEVPFVKNWSKDVGFYRYSVSKRQHRDLLMAEFAQGKKWYVIGYLTGNVDLPER